jgi:hypothetical protein
MKYEFIAGKSTDDLLKLLYTHAGPHSPDWEQLRMAIFVRCAEDLERSIRDFTASNDKLSGRLFCLNIILGVFTVVGAVLTVWSLIKDT